MLSHIFSKNYLKSLFILVEINIIKQNRNYFLGASWGLIQPFVHITIISYFFGFLLKKPMEEMVLNLVSGLPLWSLFSSSLLASSNSLITRENIVKKTLVSKTIFPLADGLVALYQFSYSFIAMYGAYLLFFGGFKWTIVLLPLSMLPLIIVVLSSSVAFAFLTPYLRDLPQLLNVLLGVAYWTVPVVYPYSLIPEAKRFLFELNPIFLIFRPAQCLIIDGTLPDLILFTKAFAVSGLSLAFSYFVYKKCRRNLVYYL